MSFLLHHQIRPLRDARALLFVLAVCAGLEGCHGNDFPSYPANYREFAYVTDGASGTVAVLDMVYLRQDRVLQVGHNPDGLAANPERDEVYAVNSGSDSVSVIDADTNRVAATIGVHRTPHFMDVAPDGKRAFVTNSGANTVSVLDLDKRREIAVAAAGEEPWIPRVAPDGRSLVVSNRRAGSVSVYSIQPEGRQPLQLRQAFPGCAGATEVAILPDSSKAFVACTGTHQVMAIWLAAAANSWRGQQDASLQHDQMLALLDVGDKPTYLALKPDGGEVFSVNSGSGSISEISTWTNEVTGTYSIGLRPVKAIVSHDDSSLWVTNSGADSATLYSIDDGRLATSVRTGAGPGPIAFSADEHLLVVADTGSGDVALLHMQSRNGPALVTLLPAGKQLNDMVVKSFTAK